jgi:hypothetical protein
MCLAMAWRAVNPVGAKSLEREVGILLIAKQGDTEMIELIDQLQKMTD